MTITRKPRLSMTVRDLDRRRCAAVLRTRDLELLHCIGLCDTTEWFAEALHRVKFLRGFFCDCGLAERHRLGESGVLKEYNNNNTVKPQKLLHARGPYLWKMGASRV